MARYLLVRRSAVPFDVIVNFDDGSGALTATKLNNGTHGAAWGSWTASIGPDHSTIEDHAITLPFSLDVAGTLYDGSSGQGLTFTETNGVEVYDVWSYVLSESVTDLVSILLARWDLSNPSSQSYNNDVTVAGFGGFAVTQHKMLPNGTEFFTAHTDGTGGRDIPYTPGWVIIVARQRVSDKFVDVYLQDASTQEVLGATHSVSSTAITDVVYVLLQDYLRGATNSAVTGTIKIKLLALRNSVLTFPINTITVPPPSSVVATQTGEPEATLTWSSTVQLQTIERNKNSGGFSLLQSSYDTGSLSAYVDADVTTGDTVQYRMTAIIGDQVSSAVTSNTVTLNSTTWTDAIAVASTNTNETNGNNSNRQLLVAGTTGNCTKIRVGIRNFNFAANIKVALYNASFAKLGQGTRTSVSTSSGSWVEVTLDSPVAVTASTTYYLGYSVSSGGGLQVGFLNGTGNAKEDFGTDYAGFPPDPFSGADNVTRTYAIGMGVI